MAERRFTFEWIAEVSSVLRGFDEIVARATQVERSLLKMGDTAAAALQIRTRNTFSQAIQDIMAHTKRLENALFQVEAARIRALESGRRQRLSPELLAEIQDLTGAEVGRGAKGPTGLADVMGLLNRALASSNQQARELVEQFARATDNAAQALGVTTGLVDKLREVQSDRLERIISGESILEAVRRRSTALEQVRRQLIDQRAQLEDAVFEALPSRVGEQLRQRMVASLREEAAATARLNELTKRRAELEAQVGRNRDQALQAALREVQAQQQAGRREVRLPTLGLSREAIAILREYLELTNQIVEAEKRRAAATRQRVGPEQQFTETARLAGLQEALTENEANLLDVNRQLAAIQGPEALQELERLVPGLTRDIDLLRRSNERLVAAQEKQRSGTVRTREEYRRLQVQINNLQRSVPVLAQRIERSLQQSVAQVARPDLLSAEDVFEGVIAGLPFLERTLIGAFQGMGRRFQATLQFAISGGFLFALQQGLQEFFQTAIEVERAFVDLRTAMEFDLADEGIFPGTGEFENEISQLRRDVLALSQDLNVLPTVANEAAFRMIARFQDTENALKALRAQLLATRVSTIDQDEVLRALTATAEGFASAVFEAESGLSLQEKLLQRETQAVNFYAEALDNAIFIQQRLGQPAEDTLEGTARVVELFSQLGFTMQETEAMVATVAQRTGKLGTDVGERMARAFSSLTDPAIVDQLLDVAAASETFTLTMSDFADGATAWRAIADQVDRIDKADPRVLDRIIQIIGQRRETDVVAAALGTTDLQRSLVSAADSAAGAAERRFDDMRVTIVEILASIGTQFEALSQNLEELGFLSPISLFLRSFEKALDLLNKVLETVGKLRDAIRSIPIIGDLGIDELLVNVLALTTAFAGLRRLANAANAAMLALGSSQTVLGAAFRGFTGGGGAAPTGRHVAPGDAAAAQAGKALQTAAQAALLFSQRLRQIAVSTLTAFGNVLKNLIATAIALVTAQRGQVLETRTQVADRIGQRVTVLGGSLNKAARSVGQFISRNAGLVTGIGAAITAMSLYANAHHQARQATEMFADRLRQVREETQRELAQRTDLTPEQKRAEAAKRDLDVAMEQLENAARSTLDVAIANLIAPPIDIMDPAKLRQQMEELQRRHGFSPEEAAFALITPSEARRGLIEGSREQLQQQANDFHKAYLEALLESLATSGRNIQLPTTARRRGSPVDALMAQIAVASDAVRDARTPEELEKAEAQVRLAEDMLTRLMQEAEDFAVSMEGSMNSLRTAFDQTTRDLRFGRITADEAMAQFQKQREDALRLAQQAEEAGRGEEVVNEFLAQADEALAGFFDVMDQTFENAQALAGLLGSEEARLAANIRNLAERVSELRRNGRMQEAFDAEIELREAIKALAEERINNAVETKQHALALADSLAEQVAATEQLIQALEVASVQAALNNMADLSEELARQAELQEKSLRDTQREIRSRRAAVQVRRNAPVLDPVAAINAEIAALRVSMSQFSRTDVEYQEGVQELRRLQAELAQELLRRTAAQVRLQVGVNDSLRNLAAEVALLNKEMEVTAEIFGDQSTEYLELKRRSEELRQELINAHLELQSVNRRLGTDVTNDFQQATEDLTFIMAQLAQQDLGELERAQLELEKRNAEAARERAFFNDRLFSLRFQFETGDLSVSAYVGALQRLLSQVDTSTQQGKEIFLEIQGIIEGLTEDISNMAFNIPQQIRLPTLFEVRRSLAADQLGVNYMDNRQQDIRVFVSNEVELNDVLSAIESTFNVDARRNAPGNFRLTLGGLR